MVPLLRRYGVSLRPTCVRHQHLLAGKLLLDYFEYLLLIEFFRESLDRSQGFAAIALCVTSVRSLLQVGRGEAEQVCESQDTSRPPRVGEDVR